ncbi:MAG TPA: hypothetical protein VF623_14280, partial [Segetibacter sp.]
MQDQNYLTGQSKEDIHQQLTTILNKDQNILAFNATIDYNHKKVTIDVDIDLGGGFESGYETTTFLAQLHAQPPFRFAIHKEHFVDEIG